MEQYLAGKKSPAKTRIKMTIILILIFRKPCIKVE